MRHHSHRNTTLETNTDFLRRYARRLLHGAHSAQPSTALPIVRRVHGAQAIAATRLTELYHARETLQLKHMFCTLAYELGYASWMPASAISIAGRRTCWTASGLNRARLATTSRSGSQMSRLRSNGASNMAAGWSSMANRRS